MPHPLYTLDVFTDTKYAGNQLAVVRHAAGIDDTTMQDIAREMNYSETTFIASDTPRDGRFDVRIFTPSNELPFAGHPTLGTAYVILQEILKGTPESITLNLGVGPITVDISYEGDEPSELWMTQKEPEWLETHTIESMAKLIGVKASEFDSRFPIQTVSTGIPMVIIALKSLKAVRQARIDQPAYTTLLRTHGDRGILVFSPETYDPENDYNARVFVDCFGVPEDPATGSANGCLAAWLSRHAFNGETSVNAKVEQGYEIKRPSQLFLHATPQSTKVGGKVVMVSRGQLL